MAQLSRPDLTNNINSNVYTNTTQAVTAANVNTVLQNINDSTFNKLTDAFRVGLSTFNPSVDYDANTCVVYNDVVYRALTNVPAGAFSFSDWSVVTLTASNGLSVYNDGSIDKYVLGGSMDFDTELQGGSNTFQFSNFNSFQVGTDNSVSNSYDNIVIGQNIIADNLYNSNIIGINAEFTNVGQIIGSFTNSDPITGATYSFINSNEDTFVGTTLINYSLLLSRSTINESSSMSQSLVSVNDCRLYKQIEYSVLMGQTSTINSGSGTGGITYSFVVTSSNNTIENLYVDRSLVYIDSFTSSDEIAITSSVVFVDNSCVFLGAVNQLTNTYFNTVSTEVGVNASILKSIVIGQGHQFNTDTGVNTSIIGGSNNLINTNSVENCIVMGQNNDLNNVSNSVIFGDQGYIQDRIQIATFGENHIVDSDYTVYMNDLVLSPSSLKDGSHIKVATSTSTTAGDRYFGRIEMDALQKTVTLNNYEPIDLIFLTLEDDTNTTNTVWASGRTSGQFNINVTIASLSSDVFVNYMVIKSL